MSLSIHIGLNGARIPVRDSTSTGQLDWKSLQTIIDHLTSISPDNQILLLQNGIEITDQLLSQLKPEVNK